MMNSVIVTCKKYFTLDKGQNSLYINGHIDINSKLIERNNRI